MLFGGFFRGFVLLLLLLYFATSYGIHTSLSVLRFVTGDKMVQRGAAAVHQQLFDSFISKNNQSFEMIIIIVTPDYNTM